jgi:hypothetical protein
LILLEYNRFYKCFFEKNLIFYPNSSGKLAVWERNSPNVIYHRGMESGNNR